MNTRADFIPGNYYHVYNQTNGGERLFKNDENRNYFLRRFCNYLKPFTYVHSYGIMSNHFHFSIQVREVEEIKEVISKIDKDKLTKIMLEIKTSEVSKTSDVSEEKTSDVFDLIHRLIVHQWQSFLVSYTKAFNNAHNRSGSLFRQKFKRSLYNPELKFQYLQYYIHHNARKHGVVKQFDKYPHTSYSEIIKGESNVVDIAKVYDWFISEEEFIKFHNTSHYEDVFKNIDLDEFV